MPEHPRRVLRRVLPDQPPCRRRLLRRAPSRRRPLRHHRRGRVRPRRPSGDRDGDDSRGGAHVSGHTGRSAGRAASHQPAFPVPLGFRDVCHGGLRGARRRQRHAPPVVGRPSAAVSAASGRSASRFDRSDDVLVSGTSFARFRAPSTVLRPAIASSSTPTASPIGRASDGSMYDPDQFAAALTRIGASPPTGSSGTSWPRSIGLPPGTSPKTIRRCVAGFD